MGPGGAGHYVKMVHNGIEYGDMQLIAEIYDLLHRGAGISNAELAEIFRRWNQGVLQSYLIEITADILTRMDEETGKSLVDLILDEAAQKGTGKWTSQNALDIGAPIPTINAAVESRLISALKAERVAACRSLGQRQVISPGIKTRLVAAAEQALYASKITSYAQGLSLLKMASARVQLGHWTCRVSCRSGGPVASSAQPCWATSPRLHRATRTCPTCCWMRSFPRISYPARLAGARSCK